MILSVDERVAIMTPTKTGTRSLEAALVKGGAERFFVQMPRHAPTAPPRFSKVFVAIRHPHARLVSMWGYGRRSPHGWFIGKVEGSFEAFVEAWTTCRDAMKIGKHHDWTSLMSDYVDANSGRKPRVFRLEDDSVNAIQRALLKLGYPITITEKHVNGSSHDQWESYWTKRALDTIGDRLDPDLDLGSYIRPKRALR